jgi:uncharacterized membrane protein YgaE (UPF0421/DUF939 family)
MAGDFNQKLPKYKQLATKYNLTQVLPDNTKTHREGNHLDQVFTKIKVLSHSLLQAPTLDHSQILTELQLDTRRIQDLPDSSKFFSQKDLKDTNSKPEFV